MLSFDNVTAPIATTSTGTATFDLNTGFITYHPEGDSSFSYRLEEGTRYSIKPSTCSSFDFENIKEIVPEKVYEFTFHDGKKVKTIREENDLFDLEYMFYLAIAKKLYSKDCTLEGVLYKTSMLQFEKKYVKAVQKGIKLFNKLKKEEFKKKEYDETKKRQHERYVRRKKEAKERKRKDQVNIIAEAIRLSKEEG